MGDADDDSGREEGEFDEATLRRLRKLFAYLDEDDSGTLDMEELKQIMNEQSGHNFSDVQMEVLMKSVSSSGNGKALDFDEFLELIAYTHKVQRIFDKFDADGSGQIDHEELEAALNAVGYKFSSEQINLFLHMADEDNSGSIGYEEFFRLEFFLRRAETLFAAADEDGSGELSFEELKELLPVVDMAPKDDAEVIRIMKTLDKDGSGELSFEEFVNLLFRLMYGIDFD